MIMKLRDENNPHYDPRFYGCDNRFWRRDIIDFRAPKTDNEKKAVMIDGTGRVVSMVFAELSIALFCLALTLYFISYSFFVSFLIFSCASLLMGFGFRALFRIIAVFTREDIHCRFFFRKKTD